MPLPLLPLLLPALLAQASDSAVARCRAIAELRAEVLVCEDNPAYRDAGERCLGELEALVQRQQARNREAMGKLNKNTFASRGARQSADFSATGDDYAVTRDSLESLRREARAVRARLDAYRAEVVYPAAWVHAEELPGGLHAVLWGDRCYAGTASRLDITLERAERILADLERTAKANADLARATARHEGNLESAGSLAHGGKARGAAAPAKRSPASASTITGKIPPNSKP